MVCGRCGNEVPQGLFCSRCGASQAPGLHPAESQGRWHRFAAHPDEPVAYPAIITTLFPHLGRQKVHEFRLALVAGLFVVFILYVAGLITAAILASAFLVPVLYLVYLYEAQVYKDEPALVLGLTIGGGVILGVLVTLASTLMVSPLSVVNASPFGFGLAIGTIILAAVLMPVVQEVIKPLPALWLRARFGETVDGLVFGVAAGLGFGLAETIIRFSHVITELPVRTDSANWIFPLLSIAVLTPLLQGSATGLVAAGVWRFGRGRAGRLEAGGVGAALVGHVGFSLGSMLLAAAGFGQPAVLVWHLLIVGGLLLYVRFLLHIALLEEAADLGLEPVTSPVATGARA